MGLSDWFRGEHLDPPVASAGTASRGSSRESTARATAMDWVRGKGLYRTISLSKWTRGLIVALAAEMIAPLCLAQEAPPSLRITGIEAAPGARVHVLVTALDGEGRIL